MIPNRIELAARAIDPAAWKPGYEEVFAERRADSLRIAKDALDAALPGLFTDPPQVWLAPVRATDAMFKACGEQEGDRYVAYGRAIEAWAAMRDAHLASQSDKPEKGEAK